MQVETVSQVLNLRSYGDHQTVKTKKAPLREGPNDGHCIPITIDSWPECASFKPTAFLYSFMRPWATSAHLSQVST